jgi:hypothetical protein
MNSSKENISSVQFVLRILLVGLELIVVYWLAGRSETFFYQGF